MENAFQTSNISIIKHHKPKQGSKRQLLALQLISQGSKPGEAMQKAGYSKWASRNPGKNLLRKPVVVDIVDRLKLQLTDVGITTTYLAGKFKQWLESDDEAIQLQAYDRAGKILGINVKPEDSNIRRKLTIEEYISGESSDMIEVEENSIECA